MEGNKKPPVSKYLSTFFRDSAQKSRDGSSSNTSSSEITPQGVLGDSKLPQQLTVVSKPVNLSSDLDNIWGTDFPEDFSEDCIILEPSSEVRVVQDTDSSVCIIDKSSSLESSDNTDIQIISSNSDYTDTKRDKGPQPHIEKRNTAILIDRYSFSSQISKTAVSVPSTSKSLLTTSSSQTFTTEWLRNQLDKVNKEYSSLKEALIAKDGESSLLRGKLRDAEQEIQKIKQQWQTACSKERTKFEERISALEKQLSSAKTQILFKSKEAESNLERYLEIKSLSIKDPESTQVKSSSSRFRTIPIVNEPLPVHEQPADIPVKKEETKSHIKKNVDAEILKLDTKVNMGKELEFFIHPDLFNEAALEFNFVIPPSTDYYPFNVMYKDISEMPSDDFSCEPLNLYNIWKVKRESFGEIMSNVIDITSDSDNDSDSDTESPPQKKESIFKLFTDSDLTHKSVSDTFPPSKAIMAKHKTSEDKNTSEKDSDTNKTKSENKLMQETKGCHPRLLYLGKSRYFTSLREIYLPLIEMCKSSSWQQKAIDEVIKHVTKMTRELYVAMCDPSIDAYYSTMHLRDNQIIDSCSDISELNLEYNIFSPKKWRDKEIYVDLRRGIALIKVLCDIYPGCMEVILNSALRKLPSELPVTSIKKPISAKGKHNLCCSKNIIIQPLSNKVPYKLPVTSIKKSAPTKGKHDLSSEKIMKQSSKERKKQSMKELIKQSKDVKLDKGMENPSQKSVKRGEEICEKCHLEKQPKVRKKKRIKIKKTKQASNIIIPTEPCSWIFEEGAQSASVNVKNMDFDEDDSLPDLNIIIAYEDDSCSEKMSPSSSPPTIELSSEGSENENLSGNQLSKASINKEKSSLVTIKPNINQPASDIYPDIHKNVKIKTNQFEECLSHKIHESLTLNDDNVEEEVDIELLDLNEKKSSCQLSILDRIIKNDQQEWVEAINSPLLSINEKSPTKHIMALRDNACCSKAEKEFLTCALSTFNKIKLNMKSGTSNEEDTGKKRKSSEDTKGHSKKLAINVNYPKDTVAEGSCLAFETEDKLISGNIKPSTSSFSLKKKRDVRPLRKSIRDDAIPGTSKDERNLDQDKIAEGSFINIETEGKLTSGNINITTGSFSFKKKRDVRPLRKSIRDEAIPGTSKDEQNLDQEIEMEIQKIFNKPPELKSKHKKKEKAKEIDLFNCDDLPKTERLNYFSILAHSGDFLMLLFEIIREIGRKRYTTNFNYLFAVIINLIHTLLKNSNPGLIQRHFLFDILQEILYCRPSPVALLQMNKLLVDVIPFQPLFTSLLCHNASSCHMVIDAEPAFFTRGACFIEVISSLIDYFMNESDWEIQTYCVRWLSYMYLIEKSTIEEWYLTQKTVCRRCHCLVLLTSMAVKIFETASSYYLRCCIENRLTYLLSCQLLEIIQSGVKVLYVMIDFDKFFSENIGDRYGMFLRFLDTVKLIHRNPEQFKEFNTNNKDLDIVQLLLIEEKVVDSIAKTSKTPETINEMAELFSKSTDWPPKSFQGDKLFLSELSD